MALSEISASTNLSVATALRILRTLCAHHLVVRLSGPSYALGSGVLALASSPGCLSGLRELSGPRVRAIQALINETTIVYVLEGTERVALAVEASTHPIRRVAAVGERVALYAGASSHVLLAYMPEVQFEEYLASVKLVPLGPACVTSINELRGRIDVVREQGYAIGHDERSLGGVGIAVPVFGLGNRVVAALQVTVPQGRWNDDLRDQCLAALRTEASALSEAMGGDPSVAVAVGEGRGRAPSPGSTQSLAVSSVHT